VTDIRVVPKFHYNDLLPTCYGPVSDTANYLDMYVGLWYIR